MKSKLCRLLAALLVLCLSSTCVAFGEGVTLSGPNEYPVVSEKITLSVFCKPKSTADMVDNYMTEWMEEKTGIHFEWLVPPSTEFNTNFNLNIESREYYDFYFGMNLSTAQVWQLAQDGVAMPLDDLIENYMPNFKAFLEAYPEYRAALTAPDGHIYCLLRTDGGIHNLVCQKVFAYEPWVEAAGMTMESISTPEGFEAYLQYVHDNDMNGNGDPSDEIPLLINSGNLAHVLGFLLAPYELQPNKRLNVVDGVVTPSFTSDSYREGLTWIRSLIEKGLFSIDSFTIDANTLKGIATNAETPMVGASGGWFESTFTDTSLWAEAYDLYTSVTPLENDKGVRATINNDGCVQLNSFISTTCPYPEALAKWCDYWYSYEGALANYFGIQGVNWDWVETPALNGSSKSIVGMAQIDPEYDSKLNKFRWGDAVAGFRGQTSEIRYSVVNDPIQGEYHFMNESLRYMDYLPEEYIPGSVWFIDDEYEIVTLYESDILSYVNECRAAFLTGTMDIRDDATWAAYLEEFEYNSMGEWVAAYQSAYDRMTK